MPSRRLALRLADLDDAVCAVPAECVQGRPDGGPVPVVLEHRVRGVTPVKHNFDATLYENDDWLLGGIEWPAELRPGVLVTVSWRAGRDEMVLRTTPLPEPMRVDGVDYFHEYDPVAVTREFAPGGSNWSQVLHTVRRLGRVFDDGSAVFPEAELPRRSGLGRGSRGSFLLRNAVEQLIRDGYVTRVQGSVDAAGEPSYPAVEGQEPTDMLLYAPLVEPSANPDDPESEGGEGADRRSHWVEGFLRRLPPGAQASERQLTLHQRTVEHDEDDEVALPPGYTFVKKHHRNG